ncbi:6-phosphogluconolactonase [Lentibacter sp. XHP0401]|jgi:6-phosphogluconolactonase|uniref:6-phosphogluconolactonase n=1 Tax=Lentibacter sp. XHP0401 TaxID=2984334 RepID=UPI0021E9AEFB|nr:6-phosphogluconolactonase [Lentibacter sp. XHP0401]MCV2892129.1 6-phosphogluconolactonase [Lentibacter sp. XHP0401]
MKIVTYPDDDMLFMGLANVLAGELKSELLHEERASFVVPGGTTPGPVFDALCAASLDWSRVDVMLSDERWRPEVHVRSNARLVRERLLQGRAAEAVFHPFYTGAPTPDETLADVESTIYPCLPISVLLLGMGTDMHTASLFPRAKGLDVALSEETSALLTPIEAEGEPEPRVTLTANVLNGAMKKHLVIIGAEKRAALERAATLPPEKAPVNAILEGTTVHWAP